MQGKGLAEKRKNVSGAAGVTYLKAWRWKRMSHPCKGLACPHWREKSIHPDTEAASLFKALEGEKAWVAPMTQERIR